MMSVDPSELYEAAKRLTYAEIGRRYSLTPEAVRGRIRRYRKQHGLPSPSEDAPHELDDLANELSGEFSLEEALDIADRLGEMMDLIDPVVTSISVKFKEGPIAIMFSSCAHIGGRYTWHKGVRDTFDILESTDRLYLALLGDEIEGFLSGFRSAEAVQGQVLPIKIQRKILAQYLQRWSQGGKILFGCHSQHGGQWFEDRVGLNPIKEDFLKTETPFFDGRGIVKMQVGDEHYVLVATHSFKGSSIYNPNHSQRRASLFDYPSADVIVQGDKHKYAVQSMSDRVDEYLADLRPSPKVWHVQAGTAKIGSDKYTIRGWQHGWFEWPVLLFYPDRHLIKQVFELEDLEYFLKERR
jgi:hypothetical protein